MKVFVDKDFCCHVTDPDNTFIEIETDFFNGKCTEFIEGYRCVPAGEIWTRSDGKVFRGEMIAPWKDYNALDAAQRQYERELLSDAENALAILLGGDV